MLMELGVKIIRVAVHLIETNYWSPRYQHGLTLILAWISNYIIKYRMKSIINEYYYYL